MNHGHPWTILDGFQVSSDVSTLPLDANTPAVEETTGVEQIAPPTSSLLSRISPSAESNRRISSSMSWSCSTHRSTIPPIPCFQLLPSRSVTQHMCAWIESGQSLSCLFMAAPFFTSSFNGSLQSFVLRKARKLSNKADTETPVHLVPK